MLPRNRRPDMIKLLATALASIGIGMASSAGGHHDAPPSEEYPDAIYQHYCAACHGEKGNGKTLARQNLNPVPLDFTSAEARAMLTRERMIEALLTGKRRKHGRPTAMVAWVAQLDRRHLEAVVDYVIITFMEGDVPVTAARRHDGPHAPEAAAVGERDIYPYGLSGDGARGRTLYALNCTKCHGARGDGEGAPALMSNRRPRAFGSATFGGHARRMRLFAAIASGRTAAHASTWGNVLTNQEIADVAEYARAAFFSTGSSTAIRR